MKTYKILQVTNTAIGAVAVDENMPLGTITRRLNNGKGCCTAFEVATSGADTVYLNESGYYKITYSGSLIAGAVGEVSVALFANGTQVYEVGDTATAEEDVRNLTLPFVVRVFNNCASSPTNCPMAIQVRLSGVAITGGTSNLIVERVY